MNLAAVFLIISSFFAAMTATAQEVDEAAVAVMKAAYYTTFANLPPSRNCEPSDVKGLWWEVSGLEVADDKNSRVPANQGYSRIRREKGVQYLRFGGYNQYEDVRSKTNLAHDALPLNAESKLKQYIVSVRGLLYLYQESKLSQTKLCFIATEDSAGNQKEYLKGDMLLMKLIEENSPKSMAIFRPVSVFVEKEEKNVR